MEYLGLPPGELPRHPRCSGRSTTALETSSSGQMGPQHPLLFLETAGDLDVDILRGKVLFAPVDAAPDLRDRHAGAVGERLQEKIFPMFVQRERRERRLLHGSFDRSMRGAVQLNRTLRDEIGIFSRLVCEPVKQFMELGESRALQVPMRLFVGRRQGRHVREVQIQPANESFLQIPIYHRRLLNPLRPLHGITCRPREDGPRYEPCAPGGRPFPNRNSPSAAVKNLAIAREMQKSVYTYTCIHPACNLSYSRSSPIRRVVGSWRRSGRRAPRANAR